MLYYSYEMFIMLGLYIEMEGLIRRASHSDRDYLIIS